MKTIILKSMHLINFKGVRDLKVDFGIKQTSIMGRNGSGKTTVFDAFTWVLFGKDSQDRKQFDIKTLDANGNVIPKLPHEVTIILDVNGEQVKLYRRFKEKWVKKRGQLEEQFTGHEEERIYNDVPCNLKEWGEKISSICTETVFKFITSPYYFTSQKTDVQRAMLIKMAGGISNEEIAKGNKDFKEIADLLTGKTIDELKREIASKKKPIKEEVSTLPERIDERKRDMDIDINFNQVESDLLAKKSELKEVDGQISDIYEAYSKADSKRMEKIKELSALRNKLMQIEMSIKEQHLKDYNEKLAKQSELKREAERLQSQIDKFNDDGQSAYNEIKDCENYRSLLISEWKKINASTITFNDKDFVCPTCHRPFDIDDIEAKQKEMTENFNTEKMRKLSENNAKGKANKKRMDDLKLKLEQSKKMHDEAVKKLDGITSNSLYSETITMPDVSHYIAEREEYKRTSENIQSLEKQTQETVSAPDNAELNAKKQQLEYQIDDLKSKLNMKEVLQRNAKRIDELETQLRTQSQELAKYEKLEYNIQQFSKARIEAIEDKINSMFKNVRFKMFEQQINGGEVETCEATVNGVPYSSLNHAGQINAGIDIINAISSKEGIMAPIIIDNAESVNELLSTNSQIVRLVVTTDDKLNVVNDENRDLFNN